MSQIYKSGDDEFDKRVDEYLALILALAIAYRDGKISRETYEREHIRATEAAIVAGLFLSGGVISNLLVQKFLSENRIIARNSARKLSRAIRDGEFTVVESGDADTVAIETEAKLKKLINRLTLWTFTVGASRVIGQLTAKPKPVRNDDGDVDIAEPMMTWVLGETEHCGTCETASDQGAQPQSYWANLAAVGIMPQGGGLECGGWNCQCIMV